MELKNLQSTYDYLKGRCSKACGHLLATQLPNVESILPSVYGDIAVSNIGVVADVETLGELSSVVQKLGSIVKDRATKKQCLPKMWYDDSSHDDLQAYYEMLVANVSSWTKRRLKASGLNDVKNLVPWLEGRYVCFSCLLSEGSRTAVEIDELLSKLHEKLKLLNRERWIQNEGVRVTSKGEARMLAQSKLDSLVLTLSKRARTVLENNGLDSVEMLAPWLNDEQRTFTNFHYCGIAISTELEDMVLKLRSYLDTLDGARIGVSKTTPQHAITAEETGPEIPVEGNSAIEEKYRALVGTLSVRALNVMKRNGLVSEEAFRKYAVDHKFNFMRLNWCGERTAEELRCFAKDVYSNSTPERGSQTTPYDSDVVGRLQVMVDEYLADKSNRTRTQMSARGLDKVGLIVPYILEPDRQHPFGALSQAGKDFSGLVSYLRTYLISTALGGNSSDSAEELPASVFDGYSAEEQAFVRGFRNQHSRWPLFYMVQKYFVHTSCSGDVIFASLYGLRGNDPLTAEEASKSFGYTRATVEQKVKSVSGNLSFELRSLIGNNDWKKYTFLKKPCFLLDSTHPDLEITQTLSDECVEPSLNLVAAMGRIFGRSVLFVDRQSLRTSSLAFPQTAFKIIAAPPLDKFLFRAALKDMVADSSIQREQPVVVDIRSRFVNDSMYWLHPTPLKNEQQLALVDVLGVCFERLLGAKYNNGIAIFPPDKVAYRDELYWILKSAGTRLHIDEIFRRLEEQHPDMKYQTPAQIAYYLKTDPRIKPIGKSSYWDLVERSRTAGSIRKMAIDTVGWAETPISLKELTESILARRPDTNAASIRSIVWQCIVSGDLCSENGRLCLPSKVHGEV